jgi:hypothetical protein
VAQVDDEARLRRLPLVAFHALLFASAGHSPANHGGEGQLMGRA